jgi:DNA-binding beta-propeller fold protein YncE
MKTKIPLLALTAVALLSSLSAACSLEPEGGRLYITSGFTDHVLVLDARSGAMIDSIPLNPRPHETDEPHGVATAPDGQYWYVTLAHGEPTLWKFELPTNRLVGRVRLGTAGAARIGITPDGRRGFIPDYYRAGLGQPSAVAVVELHDLTVTATPTVCPAPHDAQVDGAGRYVAVTCSLSDEIVILDASTLQETNRFLVGESPGAAGSPRFKPLNVLWAAGGRTIYVTLHNAGVVREFTVGGEIAGSVDVGSGPAQLALTPNGRTLVVANRADGSASIIELATMSEENRVALGVDFPHGVAISHDGQQAFVTYEGSTNTPGGVVALDLQTADVRWRVAAGTYTLGAMYISQR